jgi:hypothetical protein
LPPRGRVRILIGTTAVEGRHTRLARPLTSAATVATRISVPPRASSAASAARFIPDCERRNGSRSAFATRRDRFDVYVCPRCGRVELFVDGIGEEFRDL